MMPQELVLCWDLDRNFPKHIWSPVSVDDKSDNRRSEVILYLSGLRVYEELPRIFSVLRVDSAPSRSTHG